MFQGNALPWSRLARRPCPVRSQDVVVWCRSRRPTPQRIVLSLSFIQPLPLFPDEFAALVFTLCDNPGEHKIIISSKRCIERNNSAAGGDPQFETGSP